MSGRLVYTRIAGLFLCTLTARMFKMIANGDL